MHGTPIFLELVVVFGVATFVATISHYVKLPTIVGFILAGIIVGPSSLGLVSSAPDVEFLAEIAGILLLFTIGLEFSFARLRDLKREFLHLGSVQVVTTIIVTAALSHFFFGYALPKATFLGFLLSLSSTALVLKLLQDSRDLATPFGKNSLGILLFQDLAVIPMMLALPLLVAEGDAIPTFSAPAVGLWLLQFAAVILGLWYASRKLIPFVLEKVVKTRSREVFFFAVLFFGMGIAYLFDQIGLSLSLGAFAAGTMISEGPYGRQITADILPLRDNFLGIFFAAVGMLLDLEFLGANFLSVVLLAFFLFFLKTAIIFGACRLNRVPVTMATITAFTVCQVGEFSFILATRGLDLGLLTAEENQYFLCVSVLSMVFTPFLYLLAPRIALLRPFESWKSISATDEAAPIRRKIRGETEDTTSRLVVPPRKAGPSAAHTVIIGFGIAGQNMAAAMDSLGIVYHVIELNYEVVKNLKKQGVNIHFGDASRKEVLEHAGIETAKVVVIAISSSRVLPHIVAAIRQERPDVHIIIRAQYVRDVRTIKSEPATEIVVGEIETSIELLARSLRIYGVDSEAIHDYMTQARSQLNSFSRMGPSLKGAPLNLPRWEALASIKPFRIGEGFTAAGKSLTDLELPKRTGASVVSVFREELGTAIPDGDFVLREGDVLHLIGSYDSVGRAEAVLKTGTQTSGQPSRDLT